MNDKISMVYQTKHYTAYEFPNLDTNLCQF